MINQEDLKKRAETLEKFYTQHEKALELLMEDVKTAYENNSTAGEILSTHLLINDSRNLLALMGKALSKYEDYAVEGATTLLLDKLNPLYEAVSQIDDALIAMFKDLENKND